MATSTAAIGAGMVSSTAPQIVYPNIPESNSAYVTGDCTYGVSQIYPNIYQYMGNAANWINSAKSQGYQVLSAPQAGTIVVYGAGGGYSQFGHVAVVTAVSGNNFTVLEMNYVGLGVWDERSSDMTDVEGFIVPPGSPTLDTLTSYTIANQQVTTPCVTFSWSIAGTTLCFDGAIGTLAVGGGLLLLLVGGLVCVAFAIGHTPAGKAATDTLDVVGLSAAARASRARQASRNATMDNEDMARASRLESIRSANAARESRRARAENRLNQRTLEQRSRTVSRNEIRSRQAAREKEEPPF